MGAIRLARPVNLICGFISNDSDLIRRAIRLLGKHVGEPDLISDPWLFDMTDYYALEMGTDLLRQFVSYETLIDPIRLVSLKILTNDLEQRICYELGLPQGQRQVNLDPGYLTLSKLVLATTKDFSHRLYIGQGIYAESTLHYEAGRWMAWPWTYPDYASPRYHGFFDQVRHLYKEKLNALSSGGADGKPNGGDDPRGGESL